MESQMHKRLETTFARENKTGYLFKISLSYLKDVNDRKAETDNGFLLTWFIITAEHQ